MHTSKLPDYPNIHFFDTIHTNIGIDRIKMMPYSYLSLLFNLFDMVEGRCTNSLQRSTSHRLNWS